MGQRYQYDRLRRVVLGRPERDRSVRQCNALRTRSPRNELAWSSMCSGRVIKELNFRRTDLIVTTKLYWGTRRGPNDMGLSRKQYVLWNASLLGRLD